MLNIYSEYTNPEGFIKFDDLVDLAVKKGIKTLGVTDHGNLAGIVDFQQKALRNGIKPIRGFDIFYELGKKTFLRVIYYLKSDQGYYDLLRILPKIRLSSKGYNFFKSSEIVSLKNILLVVDLFNIDTLSARVEQETDQEVIISFLSKFDRQENIFFRTYEPESEQDNECVNLIKETINGTSYQELYLKPIYYLKKAHYKVKQIQQLLNNQQTLADKNQYFTNPGRSFLLDNGISSEALDNRLYLEQNCNLILDDQQTIYPEFLEEIYGLSRSEYNQNLSFDFDYQEQDLFSQLQNLLAKKISDFDAKKILGVSKSDFKRRLEEELNFFKERKLSKIILSMHFLKKEFIRKEPEAILFFGSIWQYFYATHLLELTIFTTGFLGFDLFESVLKTRKFTAELEVHLATKYRKKFLDFIHNKLGKDKICYLSEYQRWNISTLIAVLGRKLDFSADKIKLLINSIPAKYKHSSLQSILKDKNVTMYLNKENLGKEFILYASLLDNTFRFFNTNPQSIIIGSENLYQKIPTFELIKDKYNIRKTFFDRKTATFFGSWTIKIISNQSLDLLSGLELDTSYHFYQIEARHLAQELLHENDNFVPYFSVNRNTYLLEERNKIMQLAVYYALRGFPLKKEVNSEDEKFHGQVKLEKKLESTEGVILFREQLYDLLQELFSDEKHKKKYSFIFHCYNLKQLKESLNTFVLKEGDLLKTEWLKKKLTTFLFYNFTTDVSIKIGIALQIVALKTGNKKLFALQSLQEILNQRYLTQEEELLYNQFLFLTSANFYLQRIKFHSPENSQAEDIFVQPLKSLKGITIEEQKILEDCKNDILFNSEYKSLLEACEKKEISSKTLQNLFGIDFFEDLPPKIYKKLLRLSLNEGNYNDQQMLLFNDSEIIPEEDYNSPVLSFVKEKNFTGFASSLWEIKAILTRFNQLVSSEEKSYFVVIDQNKEMIVLQNFFTEELIYLPEDELLLNTNITKEILTPFNSLFKIYFSKTRKKKVLTYFDRKRNIHKADLENIEFVQDLAKPLVFQLTIFLESFTDRKNMLYNLTEILLENEVKKENPQFCLNLTLAYPKENITLAIRKFFFSYQGEESKIFIGKIIKKLENCSFLFEF